MLPTPSVAPAYYLTHRILSLLPSAGQPRIEGQHLPVGFGFASRKSQLLDGISFLETTVAARFCWGRGLSIALLFGSAGLWKTAFPGLIWPWTERLSLASGGWRWRSTRGSWSGGAGNAEWRIDLCLFETWLFSVWQRRNASWKMKKELKLLSFGLFAEFLVSL